MFASSVRSFFTSSRFQLGTLGALCRTMFNVIVQKIEADFSIHCLLLTASLR